MQLFQIFDQELAAQHGTEYGMLGSRGVYLTHKVFCRTCGRRFVAQLKLQNRQVPEKPFEEQKRCVAFFRGFQRGPLMNNGLLLELASLLEQAHILVLAPGVAIAQSYG